ncbi:MAG: hypothetical protein ACXVEE_21415 [Polyangiales bacterium]
MSARVIPLPMGEPLADGALFRALGEQFYVFDPFVSGARRVDLHPLVLSRELHESARRAAVSVARTIEATAERCFSDPEERARYRLPRSVEVLAEASRIAGDDARLVRVDLLLGEEGWVACEVNADCPGGHNEALGLPELCLRTGFAGGHDPTTVVDALADRLAGLAGDGAVGLLFATAYAEDLQVCALMKRALEEREVEAVLAPPTAPRLRGGSLFIGRTRVSALYRFFPTEWLVGQSNMLDLIEATGTGAVRNLTGFQYVYSQSKLAFARAPASAALPRTLMVEELTDAEILADRAGWVLKRSFGRVGDEVLVGALISDAEWKESLAMVRSRASEAWIAQRFVRQRTVPTPWGPRYATLGAYVLDGEFVGYFARLTPESHVSHDALCLPVLVAEGLVGEG